MRAAVRFLILTPAALALAGCISLLPKAEPAQLYRFGADAAVSGSAAAGANARSVGILKPNASFTQAAAGDRILSVNGGQAAYIAEARWVAPASVLFNEAVARGFDANPGPARLVTRGEVAQANLVLRLDVRSFETVYDNGLGAPPQVVVRVRAALTRGSDRALVGEKVFEQSVRAGDNRVGAIVAAYDRAVGQFVRELIDWTNAASAA